MEILTNIKTTNNLSDLEAIENLMDNPEFIKIYYEHIEPTELDYMFQDCNGFIKVIIW